MRPAFLTDKDITTLLRISNKTLYFVLHHGPNAKCAVDLRLAQPITVGTGRKRGQRRWSVGKVAELIGISRADIWEALN